MKYLKEDEQTTRTVSGFQEFTKNGKESICEDTIKNKKIYLRKKKEK